MAGTAKTDEDIRREDIAYAMNRELLGTGMTVLSGGSGPGYTLLIHRLNRDRLTDIIKLIAPGVIDGDYLPGI